MDLASAEKVILAIATIVQIAAPIVQQGYSDGKEFAELIYDMARGEKVSNAQVDEALAKANALSARVQSPDFLPPRKPDDI